MASLNISLPQQLKAYVESQVAQGEYGTPSEYMRDLIRRDKEVQHAKLEKKLLKAVASASISVDPRELEGRSLVAVLREKISARSAKR